MRIRARVRGWVVTRLRNAARQHLAFYYASTCEAARCRIAVPCRFLEVFSETSGCLPSTLRLRQMGLVNTCLGSPGWSNVFSGPRGYLRRSSQDLGLYQMGFAFFSCSWHPGAAFGIMGCLKKRPGVKKFGRLRAVLEAFWAILRQSWSVVEPILEALLGHLKPSWAVLKVSWAVLRPSSGVLGHSSAVLERPAAIVTALVACLGRLEAILDAVESARDV